MPEPRPQPAPPTGWTAWRELPEPLREAFSRGEVPPGGDWTAHPCFSPPWLEAIGLPMTLPFGLFALVYAARIVLDLLTDPAQRTRFLGYLEGGDGFAVGITVVSVLFLGGVGSALLVHSYGQLISTWHATKNHRALRTGRRHYGLLVGPEHLALRRPSDPWRALVVRRADVANVETAFRRREVYHYGAALQVGTTVLDYRQGDTLYRVQLADVVTSGGGLTEALASWAQQQP